jgi:general stress protein YciG
MAQKKSQAKDETMTTRQAGKLGGDKVKAERGPEFYSEIGRMQGAEVNPGNARKWSRLLKEAAAHAGNKSTKPFSAPMSWKTKSGPPRPTASKMSRAWRGLFAWHR